MGYHRIVLELMAADQALEIDWDFGNLVNSVLDGTDLDLWGRELER